MRWSTLYQCYDLLHPDVIMELAWKHKITDFAMPYLVQVLREYQTRLEKLEKAEIQRKEEATEHGQPGGMMEPQLMLTYPGMAPGAAAYGQSPYGQPAYPGAPMPGHYPPGGVMPGYGM